MENKGILQFFNELFGPSKDKDGVVYFTEELKKNRDAQVHPSRIHEYLTKFADSKPLFFTPNIFQKGTIKEYGKGREDHNVRVVTCLFWDFDSFRVTEDYLAERGFPPPTYIFRRGDRAHIYYIFETPIEITSSLDPLAKKITKILKTGQKMTGADPMPTHIGSVLRVPGTTHIKKGVVSEGYQMPFREGGIRKYKLRDFDFILKAAGETVAKKEKPTTKRKDGLTEDEIKTLLLDSHNIITAGAGRSNALFRFGIRCRDWGLSEAEALEVASRFNESYCNPPETADIVSHQIKSAFKYASGPAGKLLTKTPELALDEFRVDLHVGYSLRDWVYVQENATLHHLEKPITYQSDQIATALSYLTGLQIKIGYVVGNRLIQVCDKMSFRPDIHERVWEQNNISYFNTFAGLKKIQPTGSKVHVTRFLDHLKYLTSNELEFEHLVNYIATAICYPEKKIRHAVLMVSPYEGTGKSSFQALFDTVLKSETGHCYVSQGNNSAIAKGYNEFIDSNLVTFFHDIGQDKYSVMDEVKTWITEERLRINGKYAKNYVTDNYTNFFLSSNNINALPIGDFDRRFFIIECRQKPKPPEYYKKLKESFTDGAGDILKFLETKKDNLDIYAPPPMTYSKKLMQAQSRSEVAILLDELYESEDPIFDKEFALKDLVNLVYMAAPVSVRNSVSQKAIARWLIANEFQHKQKRTGEDKGWKYHPPEKKKKEDVENKNAKGAA